MNAHATSDLQRVLLHGKCSMYMYLMPRTFGACKGMYCEANQYKEPCVCIMSYHIVIGVHHTN